MFLHIFLAIYSGQGIEILKTIMSFYGPYENLFYFTVTIAGLMGLNGLMTVIILVLQFVAWILGRLASNETPERDKNHGAQV